MEHIAAPVIKIRSHFKPTRATRFFDWKLRSEILPQALPEDKIRHDYGAIIHGSAPELMLDLWREAFRHFNRLPPAEAATQLNKFILNHPQLQNPQASQLRLTTGHAWKTYAMGPNAIPNARPGMFLQTLPAPVYRDDRVRREAENDERAKLNQSLYADGGFNLTLSLEDYRLPDPPLTEAQINSHKIFGTPLPVHPPRYGRHYRRGGGSGRSETEPNSSSLGREVATGGTNEFPIELFQPPEISEEEIDPFTKPTRICNLSQRRSQDRRGATSRSPTGRQAILSAPGLFQCTI